MVVQHNLIAMNSNRMLGITTGQMAGTTEKLSSGYQINKAADNAAGLAISEKMRQQVRGLTQASTNAEDGISCVQTAEGALAEVQDMLQRMNELCVQAANGTQSSTDRQYIQDEIDQLCLEIDRVAETTKFNETFLLKGDIEGKTNTVYMTDYSVTFTKNETSNAIQDASKYKLNYTGDMNLYVIDAKILEANSNSAISAYRIQNGSDITEYFSDASGSTATTTDATDVVLNSGAFTYKTTFNTNSYAAFINVELNSNLSTDNTPNGDDANGNKADLFIDATSSIIRASIDLYFYNTDTENIVRVSAGESVEKYLKDDRTVEDKYRLVDIVYADSTRANITEKYSDRIADSMGLTGTDNFFGTRLELDESKQKLYDVDGEEVSGIRLNEFFNENGTYTGGLYTTSQARLIDQVFASAGSQGYAGVSSLLGNAAATIGKYIAQSAQKIAADLSFNLHVGAQSNLENKIETNISTLTAAGLGVDKLSSDGIGIVDATGNNATSAIDVVAKALNIVSRQRSNLGAVQNRLEHTIKNLDNVVENTTAAESQIRDTDMATEMVKHANMNILQQAGQAMLAQANQSNEGVLSLLQ